MKIIKVIFDKNVEPDTGQISNGVLLLNPTVWERLTDQPESDFVLLLENHSLILQTSNEFKTNKNFLDSYFPPIGLINPAMGKKINVIEKNEENLSSYNGIDPVGAIAEAGGKLAETFGTLIKTLPVLGVGKKGRMKEENNTTENQLKLAEEQLKLSNQSSDNNTKLAFVVGIIVMTVIILFFVFKN